MELRKHAWWLIGAGVLALGIVAREHPQARSKHAPPPLSAGRDVAAEQPDHDAMKTPQVDRRHVQKIGVKAFEIVRTGPMRAPGDAKKFVLSRLEQSRRGDALGTYDIYLAVLDCKSAGSPAELQMLDAMRPATPHPEALAMIEQRLEECAALLSDPRLMSERWLQVAAEQGSLEAMLMYAVDTQSLIGGPADFIREPERVIEWKRNALRYLESAAALGSVDALLALARSHDYGALVSADRVQAYAYYLAASRASPGASLTELLASYEAELSAKQVQAARAQSAQIYDACCIR